MNIRLLTLFLLSTITFSCFAQSLELSDIHGIILPNSVIVQEGTPDSVKLITYLNVKNIGVKTINVICKKYQLTMLDSTEITMCWAGSCYSPEINVSPNAQPIEAGQTITDFIGHYNQQEFRPLAPGESVVSWVFFDSANVKDSISVTIKYTSYPLDIEDVIANRAALSNAYPNPAGVSASFDYSIEPGSTGSVIIRNILGSTVQSGQLISGSGKFTINTTNLKDGIYFYSLLVDSNIPQVKKLIVKH